MRHTIALALALWLPSAPAIEVQGNTFILSDDDVVRCNAGGGCGVITREALEEFQRRARKCEGGREA